MHRSGTSAAAGALAHLGVDLGGRLHGPQAGVNERGFWEHRDVTEAHDELFLRIGSCWDDILTLPPRWWLGESVEPALDRLARLVRRDFSRAALWAIKDPRVCRLLPAWGIVAERVGLDLRYLQIVRPPAEVSASLARRDHFPEDKSRLLWLYHNLEAERHTRGCPRVFVLFEQLLREPGETLGRVEARLGLRFPVPLVEALPRVREFLSAELRHHRAEEAGPSEGLAGLAADAYRVLAAAARGDGPDPGPGLDEVAERLADHVRVSFSPVLVDHLRAVASDRCQYRRLFFEAYNSRAWRVFAPLRALERLVTRG
jgi:hypothetical protein